MQSSKWIKWVTVGLFILLLFLLGWMIETNVLLKKQYATLAANYQTLTSGIQAYVYVYDPDSKQWVKAEQKDLLDKNKKFGLTYEWVLEKSALEQKAGQTATKR